MKVWITKYALTSGIQEHEANCAGGMVALTDTKFPTYYHKPYWHESPSQAKAHAEEMRIRKIASLKRQITKLETFRFIP